MKQAISCAAVVACRNEIDNLKKLLPHWLAEGLEIILIDHDSTDGTAEWATEKLGKEIYRLEHMKWEGSFNLRKQLEKKESITKELKQDWLLHLDADEWPHTRTRDERLIDAISRADNNGFNAINFEEFVFLPTRNEYSNYHYYFFEPAPHRLMRGWKRNAFFKNTNKGGHRLEEQSVNMKLAKEDFVLRHYITHSQEHIVNKYLTRKYEPKEITQGWHRNRLQLCSRTLTFPDPIHLQQLEEPGQKELDRREPHKLHYWQWSDNTKPKKLKTLICLYGCEDDKDLLEAFNASALNDIIRKNSETRLIEVWGNGTGDKLNGRRLTLQSPDIYNKLSLKTQRMMQVACRMFKFKQLIKIDLTCMRTDLSGKQHEGRKPVDQIKLLNYVKNRIIEPIDSETNYDGLNYIANPKPQGIRKWGEKKGGTIDLDAVFSPNTNIPSFYSGKCYSVSRKLALMIGRHGLNLAKEHEQYLNGSEDLMVARMALKLKP